MVRNRVLAVSIALPVVLVHGCGRKDGRLKLTPDETVLGYTEERKGYRFVAERPVTVALYMEETGKPDVVLRQSFEAGETVQFGYRLTPMHDGDPASPSPCRWRLKCVIGLGLFAEGAQPGGGRSGRTFVSQRTYFPLSAKSGPRTSWGPSSHGAETGKKCPWYKNSTREPEASLELFYEITWQ